MKMPKNVSGEKIALAAAAILLAYLALKSFKQFVFLSFTLLSLKLVWILVIVLVVLTLAKKRT